MKFTILATPNQMSALDRKAIREYGIKGEILMENASRQAVSVLKEHTPVQGKKVLVIAGGGNNGGDGICIARHLKNHGAEVSVFLTKPQGSYKGESRYHLGISKKCGVDIRPLPRSGELPRADIVVDALLGTGFAGELRPDAAGLVNKINELGENSFVLAMDIPSGLSGLTGRPGPVAVRADATVTFHTPKTGLVMPWSSEYTGQLHVREIGIPADMETGFDQNRFVISEFDPDTSLRPVADMHKGSSGHVLVVAGTPNMSGAARLSALAAFRAGAGLVTVACPESMVAEVKSNLPEAMTLPMPASEKGPGWCADHAKAIHKNLERFDAVVVGPGLGRTREAGQFINALLPLDKPFVLDADGLFHLAASRNKDHLTGKNAVLTPHPGETAFLLNTTVAKVQQDRFAAAEVLARETGAVCVLKGAGSIISQGNESFIYPKDCPNLAVAGSGDVLSGIAGALLGRGFRPLDAARTSVCWHVAAGEYLAEEFPVRGNLAHEIAEALPLV